jgi:transposase
MPAAGCSRHFFTAKITSDYQPGTSIIKIFSSIIRSTSIKFRWVQPRRWRGIPRLLVQFQPTQPKTHNEEMTQMANNSNSNQLLVSGAEQALDQMKYEIAQEFGVNLGADTTSRANGSVGGEITKRLVQMAEQQLGGTFHS